MITVIDNQGRTGNQMFSLAFGFALAHRLEVGMRFEMNERVPTDWFPHIYHEWPNLFQYLHSEPIKISDSESNMDDIAAVCGNRDVVARGCFERSEFYLPHRGLFKRAFWQDLDVPSHDVVMHIRGGDFKTLDATNPGLDKKVPSQFYAMAWNRLECPSNVVVVTDDIPYARTVVAGMPCGFVQSDPEHDFKLMRAARTLVIPRSTFSWWAAFLSDARVIQALPKSGDRWKCRNHMVHDWEQIYY